MPVSGVRQVIAPASPLERLHEPQEARRDGEKKKFSDEFRRRSEEESDETAGGSVPFGAAPQDAGELEAGETGPVESETATEHDPERGRLVDRRA